MLAYPGRALMVFAWTTIGFAVLDVAGSRTKLAADWDPRKIPDWMVGTHRQDPPAGPDPSGGGGRLRHTGARLVPAGAEFAVARHGAALDSACVRSRVARLVRPAGRCRLREPDARRLRIVPSRRTARRVTLKLSVLSCQLVVALMILSARVWVVAGPVIKPDVALLDKLPELLTWVNMGVAIGFGVVVVITSDRDRQAVLQAPDARRRSAFGRGLAGGRIDDER